MESKMAGKMESHHEGILNNRGSGILLHARQDPVVLVERSEKFLFVICIGVRCGDNGAGLNPKQSS